jgi:hypothetical protein
MSRLQKKPPAHKRAHPTLQNMIFFYFCGSFLLSWIRIRIQITDPDPDPMVRLNMDPIRIRIRLRNTAGIKAKSYEERCKELGLDTLEKRRNIQDMVETFRILCSNNDGYASGILETVRTTGARTRQAAEPLNLVHKYRYARTEVRRNSFSVRVAEPWNKLSRETREAKNVQQFKRLLKNEWK